MNDYTNTRIIALLFSVDTNLTDGIEPTMDEPGSQRLITFIDSGNGIVNPESRNTLSLLTEISVFGNSNTPKCL